MLGFGLCVVGASIAGYAESLHSTAGIADGWIVRYASVLGVAPNGTFLTTLLAQTNGYIQQSVTPVWADYLAIGIVIAICGTILVAAGDRKTKVAESPMARQAQPSR
jgi:hypothetical protein